VINELLSQPVLHGARWILHGFGYQVQIAHQSLQADNIIITLGTPCLGKGLFLVFCVLILFNRGNAWEKIGCITTGAAVLLVSNIFRISLLFAFVHQYGLGGYNYNAWHDIYSYIICLVLLFVWWRCSKKW
jgi:exosortase/archaeosortase family protein